MRLVGIAWLPLAALVGAAVSVAAVTVHRTLVLGLPVGLVLASGATITVGWSLRLARPVLATAYAAGWLVPVGLVVSGRPEGDFAVANDLYGYLLMGLALGVVVMGVTSFARRDSSSAGRPT